MQDLIRVHLEQYIIVLQAQYRAIQNDDTLSLEATVRAGQEELEMLRSLRSGLASLTPQENFIDTETDLTTRIRELHGEAQRLHFRNRKVLGEKTAIIAERLAEGTVVRSPQSVFRPATHGGNMVDVSV